MLGKFSYESNTTEIVWQEIKKSGSETMSGNSLFRSSGMCWDRAQVGHDIRHERLKIEIYPQTVLIVRVQIKVQGSKAESGPVVHDLSLDAIEKVNLSTAEKAWKIIHGSRKTGARVILIRWEGRSWLLKEMAADEKYFNLSGC